MLFSNGEVAVLHRATIPCYFCFISLYVLPSYRTVQFKQCNFVITGLPSRECALGCIYKLHLLLFNPTLIHQNPTIGLLAMPGGSPFGSCLFKILGLYTANLWMVHLVGEGAAMQSRARTLPASASCSAISLLI